MIGAGEMMDSQEKVDAIVMLIWQLSGFGITQLLKKEEFNKLKFETIAKISTETTLFLLHFCDREIFSFVGPQKRDVIMVGVLEKFSKKLEEHDDKVLKKLYGERSDKNLDKYFDYLSKSAFSVGFREAYNERQVEYGAYKKLYAEKGEPLKDTLVWEFGKKINLLATEYPHPVITTSVSILASEMIITCIKSLKQILEIEK